MPKITTFLLKIYSAEKDNFWLFAPVFFGFGAAFYFQFEENFLTNFNFCLALFFATIIFYLSDRYSFRSLIYVACGLFLAGGFYANFYQKFFCDDKKITGKIYVDAIGKVESVKEFYNAKNGVSGANLVISKPVLYKSKFVEKTKKSKPKKTKKKKKKREKKKSKRQQKCEEKALEKGEIPDCIQLKKTKQKKKKTKQKKKKTKKHKAISKKTIEKKFVNLADFQEIDREFLDYSKNYQQVEWLQIKGRERFPQDVQKISVNLIKNFQQIKVNDVVALRAMLQPPKAKEFPDDFDIALDAKFKKISAFGYVLGEAKIVKKAEISSLDSWFISLRQEIRGKIFKIIQGDEAAIAAAFLIGDQDQISDAMMRKIRASGLAHLLSISGFHLSLASAICLVSIRFLLSRSQYLALHFDLKKIAAFFAILGTYFYLQISASPIPAQRAFLMVLLVLLALFFGEKINAKRAVMTSALILILLNPYAVFNLSFQLSFAAILVLVNFSNYQKRDFDAHFLRRFFGYFFDIILLSILIQIATIPFLMRSFQNLSLLGFVANVLAIPLASFVIMPLGFLALFLMSFSFEKYALIAMKWGIILLEKIIIFVADFDLSNVAVPQLSSFGLVIAIIGLLIICLTKTYLRFVGVVIFLLSFTTIFYTKKPDILFDGKQKFFAIYRQDSLIFSKDLKPSKQRQAWMNRMNENQFKTLKTNPQADILCDEKKCLIAQDPKILVLLSRNKISEICQINSQNNLAVIVNMTKKYQLPECIAENVIKIDNEDFYQKGGQFFYFEEKKISLKTTF